MPHFRKIRPTLCSEMFRFEQNGNENGSVGLLVHSFKSFERIKKWDGQALPENQENTYNITVGSTPRVLNIYAVASTKNIA